MTLLMTGSAIVLIGFTFIWTGTRYMNNRARRTCLTNLQQIGMATSQYLGDYDLMFPRGAAWSDELMPYIKNTKYFQCPQRGVFPQGYAMHRSATGAYEHSFNEPEKMVLYFEADAPNANTLNTGSMLPQIPRHGEGHHIAFADNRVTHVRMVMQPDFKFGYDANFERRKHQFNTADAKFWEAYNKKQETLWRQKIAIHKKQ
ncbi:MAG TPA: hypothetical protein VF719_11390 [Abditibacteriaceae bacterium]